MGVQHDISARGAFDFEKSTIKVLESVIQVQFVKHRLPVLLTFWIDWAKQTHRLTKHLCPLLTQQARQGFQR